MVGHLSVINHYVKQTENMRWTSCNKLCGRPPQYARPLQVDLLTLKVVSESRVTWVTSVPILVFLGLFVLDLGPMYATERQTSDAHHRLMPPTLGAGHNNFRALLCFGQSQAAIC